MTAGSIEHPVDVDVDVVTSMRKDAATVQLANN